MKAYAWHVHHDALLELLTEPLEVRAAYIRDYKPSNEHGLRLRLLHPVIGPLSAPVVAALAESARLGAETDRLRAESERLWAESARLGAECARLGAECSRLRAESARLWDEGARLWDESVRMRDEGNAAHAAEIEALHRVECPDCPWDGQTIFPAGGTPPAA